MRPGRAGRPDVPKNILPTAAAEWSGHTGAYLRAVIGIAGNCVREPFSAD